MSSELWYTEKQTDNLKISFRVKETLYSDKSEYQTLDIVDTYEYGRMLFLDGLVMTNIKDEYVYHEMITLVPLNTHPNPKKVLVIGGGDGGAIREIVKYPTVEKATLVEIDGKVIEASKEFLPEIAGSIDDPKVEVRVQDGIEFINSVENEYDVICVDSSEPIGPGIGLFVTDFYKAIHRALKDDGIFVAQTQSPRIDGELLSRVNKNIGSLFPITKVYLAHIPTYPTGMWSFTMGSKKYDPEKVAKEAIKDTNTRYYNADIHFGAFSLPNFVKEFLK